MTKVLIYGASDDLVEFEVLEGDGRNEEYYLSASGKGTYVVEDDQGRSMIIYAQYGKNGWELHLSNNPEAGADGEKGYADEWDVKFMRRPDGSEPDPAIMITASGKLSFTTLNKWRKAVKKREDERLRAAGAAALAAQQQAQSSAVTSSSSQAQAASSTHTPRLVGAVAPSVGNAASSAVLSPSVIEKLNEVSKPLSGLTICVTGSTSGTMLHRYTRRQLAEKIQEWGGLMTSSVSHSTDLLVRNRAGTVKDQKAQALGIAIMTVDEFVRTFNLQP